MTPFLYLSSSKSIKSSTKNVTYLTQCDNKLLLKNNNFSIFFSPIFRISPKDADTDSCQHLSRKKRRGVIEKKRRDRINSSLSELKRLVPSAYEKQGSAKLEKAEILQLTVDHLKTLHAKGVYSNYFLNEQYAKRVIRGNYFVYVLLMLIEQ